MDGVQILIIIMILILTGIISVVGIQFFLVLKDFRITLAKVDKVLYDVSIVSEALSKPASLINGLISGIKLVNKFSKKKGEKNE